MRKIVNASSSLGEVAVNSQKKVLAVILIERSFHNISSRDADALQMHHHLLPELGDSPSSECCGNRGKKN